MLLPPPKSTLFPYTTLFRSYAGPQEKAEETFKPIRTFKKAALDFVGPLPQPAIQSMFDALYPPGKGPTKSKARSEEHTSELQSLRHLVCRLLLEKKNK